ncbi:S- 2 [Glycine max]|nr:S- 2 [Glycine max]
MLKPLVTILVFLMVASAQDSLSDNTIFEGKQTVRVYNGMNDGILVYLHCRSKDNDLGQHVLAFGEFQKWSFNDNLFGTTLFWCTMNASNVHASFEVYRAKTEENKCDTQCNRILKKTEAIFLISSLAIGRRDCHGIFLKHHPFKLYANVLLSKIK